MLRLDRRLLGNVAWPLLGAAFAIVLLSILCLSSLGLGRGGSGLALRQLMWVGVGTVALLVVVTFDYRSFVRAAPVLYLVGLGLLTTVFVLGRMVSGARRWIHVGPLTFQPSELFKLIFILTLAWALTPCPSCSWFASPLWEPRSCSSPSSAPFSSAWAYACASSADWRGRAWPSCRSRGSSSSRISGTGSSYTSIRFETLSERRTM